MKHGKYVLMVEVTVSRLLPLAKGGSVITSGTSINQKDIKAAHDNNLLEWRNAKGGIEHYHEVIGIEYGEADSHGDCPILSEKIFWYFPTEDGRPGRGLTQEGGKALSVRVADQGDEDRSMRPQEGSSTPVPSITMNPSQVAKSESCSVVENEEVDIEVRTAMFGGTLPQNVDPEALFEGQEVVLCVPEVPELNGEDGTPRLWHAKVVRVTNEGLVQVTFARQDGTISDFNVLAVDLYTPTPHRRRNTRFRRRFLPRSR